LKGVFMPVPGITNIGVVTVEKYQRCKDVILANSTALQIRENDRPATGLSDEELASELDLSLWEVREIRAVAKRDANSLDDWRRADEYMQSKHISFVLGNGESRAGGHHDGKAGHDGRKTT